MDHMAIFASGKSSRFGGFPKAFCSLGKMKNVENTIDLAKKHFKEIYLVVNEETYASGVTKGIDAQIVSIVTGQGDADSILKALRYILGKTGADSLCVCWGDAVFLTDEPFLEMGKGLAEWSSASPVLAGCSVDPDPYAWFETDGRRIVKSHFKRREKEPRDSGLHDQSIFAFRTELLMEYLTLRKHELGLDRYDENTYDPARGEMGLLDSFTWFYEQPGMSAAEICYLTPGRVMSFNTPDELEQVIDNLNIFQRQRGK